MPRFQPFAGLRYTDQVDLDRVIAPPYDVVSPDDRGRLASSSPYNAIEVELPSEGADGTSPYLHAAELFKTWTGEDVLAVDAEPAFYGYRMLFTDEAGRDRQTTGVVGALELSRPGEGDILPHERTTTKDKADRLELLRATAVNTSPVWGLSPAVGLTGLVAPDTETILRAIDDEGTVHELWAIVDDERAGGIADAVASAPLIVADGHHRTEVALAYRDERHAAGAGPGPWDSIMALVVELADDQLDVRPIHRLINGLREGLDLETALEPWFEVMPTAAVDASINLRMADAGALALVTPSGTWLLRPRPETIDAADQDLDSSRLDVALAGLGSPEVRFQHGWEHVVEAVAKGDAQAGVLLRPATVAQIAATGRGVERMPPKTTFFYPKPRTGMVFRPVG